jgi:hypothetical protein
MATASYDQLNDAIARAYYRTDCAGETVYLDLDDDALEAAGVRVGLDRNAVVPALVQSVRRFLPIGDKSSAMFSRLSASLSRWAARRRQVSTRDDTGWDAAPPIVGILTLFTAAAEMMGADGAASNNYFSRLFELLQIPPSDQARTEQDFRRVGEWYWDTLATWLEGMDGEFGLPSAAALAFRHVGLPISQALVREADRRQITQMFDDMGLQAGMPISTTEMKDHLAQWLIRSGSKNLQGMWRREAARDRIAEIAVVEFSTWDGDGARSTAVVGERRAVRLVLSRSSDLFTSRYRFAAVFPRAGDDVPVSLELADGRSEECYVRALDANSSILPFESAQLDARSGLEGVLRLRRADDSRLVRHPRKVVPLLRDPELNLFLETDSLAVGADAGVLVEDKAGLVRDVERLLSEIARPGYHEVNAGTEGLPTGWVLFRDVQVVVGLVEDPPTSSPLRPLAPRIAGNLTLVDGYRIPGSIPRWNLLDLPDVLAVSEDSRPLVITLEQRDLETNEVSESILATGGAPLVVRLRDHVKDVGDYALILTRGRSETLQRLALRVRGAVAIDQSRWSRFPNIAHVTNDPMWAVRARPASDDESPAVVGALTFAGPQPYEDHPHVAQAKWSAGETARASARNKLPASDPTSCTVTGAHRWRYPTFDGKFSYRNRYVTGTCTSCGMTRRDPGNFWDKRLLRSEKAPVADGPLAKDLLPAASDTTSWEVAVDTIIHLGQGKRTELSAIARQLDDSAIFESHFIRSLESIGFLEYERDDRLQIQRFEVGPTALAGLASIGTIAVGAWDPGNIIRLRESAGLVGARVEVLDADSAGTLSVDAQPEVLAESLRDEGIAPQPRAGITMLEALPHIGQLLGELVEVPDPLRPGEFDVFAVADNRWLPGAAISVGALRRRSWAGSEYYFRATEDIENRVVRVATLDTSKYLAAWYLDICLFQYDVRRQELTVPLGAPLPGLFERAAVLCSGRLPIPVKDTWSLVYSDIPATFAEELRIRLT